MFSLEYLEESEEFSAAEIKMFKKLEKLKEMIEEGNQSLAVATEAVSLARKKHNLLIKNGYFYDDSPL